MNFYAKRVAPLVPYKPHEILPRSSTDKLFCRLQARRQGSYVLAMSRVCSNHHITVQEVIAIAPAVAIRANTMVIATVTGSRLIQPWGALDS